MALSTFFLGILFLLTLFYSRYTQNRQYATLTGRGVSLRPLVTGKWRYVASAACLLLIAIGVILPMTMLIMGSFMRLYGFFCHQGPLHHGALDGGIQ